MDPAAIISATLARILGAPQEDLRKLVAPPSKTGVDADYAVPCFQLAKLAGGSPPQVATRLASEVPSALPGVQAEAAGPFLNLRLDPAWVASQLLPTYQANPLAVLRSDLGAGKRVCIDFSSPNIAKHLAFHHIRSTMLGNSLSRLYGAAGWQVTRINFLGDWGTAFGRLIAGWKREGLTLEQLDASGDRVSFLNALYVRISQAAKEDPTVEEEARRWSKALEDGNQEARRLWQLFKDASLSEFKRVYDLLEVDFDSWKGEAFYEDKMAPVLEELQTRGLISIDDGATVVDLSAQGFKKPCLIKRADGGTLYATRDLTAADDRHQDFQFDRALYVVDMGQALHFREWFAVAKLLGRPYAENLRHVAFGLVLIWNDEEQKWAKGRTRNGVPMLLLDVLNEAIERAAAIIREKNPELPAEEQAAVACAVGIGAVVFNDLKNGRQNDVRFRFEDALAMQGETGPYLQYAHARLCSILRKAGTQHAAINPALLTLAEEKRLLLSLARLRFHLERAVQEDEPSVLASALLGIASDVGSWMAAGNQDSAKRVLCEDSAVSAARLALVDITRAALAEGLRLLGLRAPERM